MLIHFLMFIQLYFVSDYLYDIYIYIYPKAECLTFSRDRDAVLAVVPDDACSVEAAVG